jgi:hypothetical protein
MKNKFYILDGKTPKACTLEQWAKWFDGNNRKVASTMIGNVRVSTVFLGLDHNFSPHGDPLLFETMIFGGEHDQYQDRCTTWEQAEAQHVEAVLVAQGGR